MQKNWPNYNKKLISKIIEVIRSGKVNYTNGDYGVEFEKKFSKFIRNKYAVAIANGTAALEVSIKSLGLPKNSEIIVPARSFFSSAACIVNTGNIPIFADVDLENQNISIKDIKKKITNKTKAILCVHLSGLPCDMREIVKIARKFKLKIIEDCSQAHGATLHNKHVGSFGDVATWSFCTDKIISTLGEGGMISTNSKKIYNFCKQYINHGSSISNFRNKSEKFIYNKNSFGTNLRITEIQSVAGIMQLKELGQTQKIREKIAFNFYKELSIYKKYINFHLPSKNVKSAWYRFYFFIKKDVKNFKKLRFKIIQLLKKNHVRCFTGACPEIYLEKSFKNLNKNKYVRLSNCKLLGESSIALDINHTLSFAQQKNELLKIRKVFKSIFN